MKVSQASDNPKNSGENGGGGAADEDDDDTIIGANDLSEDSDSAATSGGIVGRFVGEGGETITVVERDPAWMAELRKACHRMQHLTYAPERPPSSLIWQ